MRWVSQVTLNAAVGATAEHVFRINSIYDPDYTGAGNSAYKYATIYGAYGETYVTSTKVMMNVAGATTTGEASIVGAYIDDDVTGRGATLTAAMQGPGAKWITVGDNNQAPKKMVYHWSAKQQWGDAYLGLDEAWASPSQNPSAPIFLHVFTGAMNKNVNPGDVSINIVFEFHVLTRSRVE